MRITGILIVLLLLAPVGIFAARGIAVYPGSLDLQNLRPGEFVSLKAGHADFVIKNLYDDTRTFQIVILPGTALGQTQFLSGYRNLPSETWVKADPDTFILAPKDSARIDLKIHIDKGAIYYNQQFCFQMNVVVVPNSATEMMQVGAFIPVYVETADTSAKMTYYGTNVGIPSVLRFDGAKPGITKRMSVTLQNNYIDEMTYKLYWKRPAPPGKIDKLTYGLTRDALPLPDTTWLQIPKQITVPAKGEKPVEVTLQLPNGAAISPGLYEAILIMSPESGLPTMVRILINLPLH